MAIKCIQANINHCAAAQDLLLQSMVEWDIKAAVVSEPYFIPNRDDWVSDQDKTVAIIVPALAGSLAIENSVRGSGFVMAVTGGLGIIGIYFSPNRALAEFERMLTEVGALIGQMSPIPVLVAGDFNAKSTAWGSPATDIRGEVLEEWAISQGLTVLNTGSESTCVRPQGESIVDVTFASNALACRVRHWRVETGVETLSDHRYIQFEVATVPATPRQNRPAAGDSPRWVLSKLDRQLAKEAAIVESWGLIMSQTRSTTKRSFSLPL
ncbi:uncharacterized protein LOC125232342 [Leguminivora glycinivorella]|uniref:uncharacterized protein LOC125232342 n=1 Tax=Leguminivora glycinivorella TaxID=1035111 RepID=UPI0020108D77|nr:uncharacterized protein LOC125232342 [Leguminivora glycinivorella]